MKIPEWQLDAEPTPPASRERERPEAPPPPVARAPGSPPLPADPPPSPLQIVEAMLFVGGPPLTAEKVCSAVRGLTPERFRELADELAQKYRAQNRPYTVQPRDDGYLLAVKPQFRGVRD